MFGPGISGGVANTVGLPTVRSFEPSPFPQPQLQSSTVSGPFYLKSGAGAVVLANQAWNTGDKMVPTRTDVTSNVAVARGWVWETIISGTSTGTPTWPSSVIQDVTTVTQNGVVWKARKPGYPGATSVNWAYATIFLDYVAQASSPLAAGDTIYVSNNHSETPSGTINCAWPGTNLSPNRVICADDGAAPPTASATTAVAATGGNNGITLNSSAGYVYFYGITFKSGTGSANNATLTCNSNLGFTSLDTCNLQIISTNVNAVLVTATGGNAQCRWKNVGVQFNAAVAGALLLAENFEWDTGSLLSGGTSPTTLFAFNSGGVESIRNIDLSNASASMNIALNSTNARPVLHSIKLPASWSGALNGNALSNGARMIMTHADNAGTNYRLYVADVSGSIRDEETIIRTSPAAASDGATPLSWKLVTNTLANYPSLPLYTEWFNLGWNDTTGSAVTATIDFNHDSLTPLDNSQIWLELSVFGAAGSPLGVLATTEVADALITPTAYPASSATWTTTGETDPNNQTITKSFTPQLKGPVMGRIGVAKASYTVYVDPPNGNTPALSTNVGSLRQYQLPGGVFINEGPGTSTTTGSRRQVD